MDTYNFIVSPENIKGDIFTVNYKGTPVGVYSSMTQVLSGGTNGSSLLTGLTVNLMLTQSAVDVGYYSPFDGAVLQKDVVANFIFSSTTGNPYTYYVYNTSNEFQKFLELSNYVVDWGDGSVPQIITTFTPNNIPHNYPVTSSAYTITLTQTNPWGITKVEKKITTPYQDIIPPNPNGTAFFFPNTGSWSATPISYNYIFSGDAVNQVAPQTSNNYTTVPYVVSGITRSRLTELQLYGPVKYQVGVPVISNGQIWGVVTDIGTFSTGYTINNINYYDFSDGSTIFFVESSGFTANNLTAEPITKDEALLKLIDQPQIQTDVYVERGKNSAYERVQRLGEVDNIGDLLNYGYGFFNVQNRD
jgi:hypothetical protein